MPDETQKTYARSYNRRNGTTYVYEVLDRHYDPDRKRTVSKRRLLGKLDPVTGEMVPTGGVGRPRGSKYQKKPADAPAATPAQQILTEAATSADFREALREYLVNEQTLLDEYARKRSENIDTLLRKLTGKGLSEGPQGDAALVQQTAAENTQSAPGRA